MGFLRYLLARTLRGWHLGQLRTGWQLQQWVSIVIYVVLSHKVVYLCQLTVLSLVSFSLELLNSTFPDSTDLYSFTQIMHVIPDEASWGGAGRRGECCHFIFLLIDDSNHIFSTYCSRVGLPAGADVSISGQLFI